MKINLLVCYHKQAPIVVKDKNYLPIQVGKNLSKIQLDMMGDNTGRNISSLNPYFCELTAQYWAWKNLKI